MNLIITSLKKGDELLAGMLVGALMLLSAVPLPTIAAGTPVPTAIVVVSRSPEAGAKEVCPDTPLRLTFNVTPVCGTGMIKIVDAADNSVVQSVDVAVPTATRSIGGVGQFNYYPLMISGNAATLYLPSGSLKYGKDYVVKIDAGAFRSAERDSAALGSAIEWRFTTRERPPERGIAKLIVDASGAGDFCTIQGAVDFVPAGNTMRRTILIRKGIYNELVRIAKKDNLSFAGEDRKQTVIAYANNAIFNPLLPSGYHRAVFMASDCRGLVIENLTIRNSTPRGGSQAEALILNGNSRSRAIVANVDLYSFQDTLQINGQAYLSHCYIEGDVDFMWGKGPCFFESCHCYGVRSATYFAQVRNPAENHGFVYHRCIFDGPDGVTGMYLNRIEPARFPYSEVVLLDCVLGPAVSPAGWLLDAANGSTTAPTTAPDLHFWEYNSRDASGKLLDVSHRLSVSHQLKMPEDAKLLGDYGKPSYVLGGGWEAQSDPDLPTQPSR